MKKKKTTSRAAKRTTMTLLCVMLGLVLVLMLGATVYVEHLLNQMNYLDADETQPYLSQDEADQLAMQETEAQDPNFTGPQLRDEDVEFADTDDIKIGGGKDVVNILLIGRDAGTGSGARSDAMILCTFNKKNNTITLTSFLRDMYVEIPGYKRNRINAAYRFGGRKLLNETIDRNFGIRVDGNIEVDFACFEKMIDRIGGIPMELTAAEAKFINTHVRGSALTEGKHVLTGKQALTYARNRYDRDGDFSRTNRQRKLLNALLEIYKSKSLPEVLALIQEFRPMISTDISKSALTGYALSLLPMLSGAEIRMKAIPVEGGYRYAKIDGKSVLVPDLEKNRKALEQWLA